MILKIILAFGIVICSTRIGILISKKYKYRLDELDELKNIFKIIENKIKYTYEPLDRIFLQISELCSFEIRKLFENVSNNIKTRGASKAWVYALESTNLSIKKEDIEILKEFGTLLGKTNKEGQINQIQYEIEILDRQIEKAKNEKDKNENVFKKLGVIFGIGIVIVFI